MRLRKFQADTIVDAVSRVKAELGPDAIIVSTREVRKGLLGTAVEVTAALDDAELGLDLESAPRSGPTTSTTGARPVLGDADVERILTPLRSELRTLRARIPSPTSSAETAMQREIAALRTTLARVVPGWPTEEPALETLALSGSVAKGSSARVVALVGPTGVGKTTTIAKLAAREALGRGRMVALVSVDTYRVGGEEQIRTFADLIGARLVVVRRLEALAATLDDLAGYGRVYVDTAGRSPRDHAAITELAGALSGTHEVEAHLALPAASSRRATDIWVERWRGAPLRRLLFTKLDEADAPDELVRAPARHRLPVSFVATGQRVPEDLEEPCAERLLALAQGAFGSNEEAAA
ncbi:MAG: hypothetical protein IT384_05815 [Deltaproteobacteria bacterium]|nr:hypothetical protein [Deltaproteobacteria bacterium]